MIFLIVSMFGMAAMLAIKAFINNEDLPMIACAMFCVAGCILIK